MLALAPRIRAALPCLSHSAVCAVRVLMFWVVFSSSLSEGRGYGSRGPLLDMVWCCDEVVVSRLYGRSDIEWVGCVSMVLWVAHIYPL